MTGGFEYQRTFGRETKAKQIRRDINIAKDSDPFKVSGLTSKTILTWVTIALFTAILIFQTRATQRGISSGRVGGEACEEQLWEGE
jgi:hypothetical protein